MAKYLKPQTPLQHQSGNYIYPITTIDQILMNNGERLNANIINVNLDSAPVNDDNLSVNVYTLSRKEINETPTQLDIIESQIMYTAMMTNTLAK